MTEDKKGSHCTICAHCNIRSDNNLYYNTNFQLCKSCRSVFYCSKDCQRAAWSSHKQICKAIQHLQHKEEEKLEKNTTFNDILPKDIATANLIGDKCIIECKLNSIVSNVLIDSGAQVSLISKS